MFLALGISAQGADTFKLVLQTETSKRENADTNEPIYFAVYYGEVVEGFDTIGRRGRTVVTKRAEQKLDNPGDDRKRGAIETYELTFNFPAAAIQGVEIGMSSGDDAWHLSGFRYYVEVEGKKSAPNTIRVSKWVSAQPGDGSLDDPAMQYWRFPVSPPSFRNR